MTDLPPPPPSAYLVEALPQAGRCNGETVSRIDIYTYAPSAITAAERAAATPRAARDSDRPTTAPFVIRAYLRLTAGSVCTEARRVDSERLLRLQRFVASAAVTAIPDGAGRVRIRVDVVDEVPWVGGARFRKGAVRSVHAGTQNLRGRGTTLVFGVEKYEEYRPGVMVVLGQSGPLGRPALADLELQQRPLGGLARITYAEPFLVNGQRQAWHLSAVHETDYALLVRPDDADAVARAQRAEYHAAWIRRVDVFGSDRVVGLAGLMLMGTDVRTGNQVLVVADSGLIVTPDTAVVARYPHYAAGRVALMSGIRALRFRTMRRLEGLRAAEDVATGAQLSLLIGPSVGRSRRSRDVLLSSDLYLGASTTRTFAALQLRAEGQRAERGAPWEGVVADAQLTWHHLPSLTRTRTLRVSGATVDRMVFPVQLTFRDPVGGLIGSPEARDAGGRRLVARLEERKLLEWPRRRASLAVGAFVDAGKLWAGDVPYGGTTPVRGSVGISLMSAFPAAGKRIFRVDLALPVNPGPGASGLAVRFSTADRTGSLWHEPRDVARARSGTGPVALMRW